MHFALALFGRSLFDLHIGFDADDSADQAPAYPRLPMPMPMLMAPGGEPCTDACCAPPEAAAKPGLGFAPPDQQ